MRRALWLLPLVLAACGGSDLGYAVTITVDVDSAIPDNEVFAISFLDLKVTGVEEYQHRFDVANQLAGRQGKIVYRPGSAGGVLNFELIASQATGTVIGWGKSDPVPLTWGKTSSATVRLSNTMIPADMTVLPDAAVPPDLSADLTVPTDDMPDGGGMDAEVDAAPDAAPDLVALPDMTRDMSPDLVTFDLTGSSCGNKMKDGSETDVDCGGSCPACAVGKGCAVDKDCQASFVCVPAMGGAVCDRALGLPLGDLAKVSFVDVAVDPREAMTLWALDFSGQLQKSTDVGLSWTPVCALPGQGLRGRWSGFELRKSARVEVSPADGKAFVLFGGDLFAPDGAGGATCVNLTDKLDPIPGDQIAGGFAIAATSGNLYAWVFPAGGSSGSLWQSKDGGKTWTDLAQSVTGDGKYASLAIDPAKEDHRLLYTSDGLSHSTDGMAWTRPSTATFKGQSYSVRFDPKVAKAYSNAGFISNDAGATWTAASTFKFDGDWAIDPAGAAYRLVFTAAAGRMQVQKALTVNTGNWSAVPAATNDNALAPAAAPSLYDRVDAVGTTVAVVSGLRLYVSKDGGAKFSQVGSATNALVPLTGWSSADSSDGKTWFATAHDWSVYRSPDGTTWEARNRGFESSPILPGKARVKAHVWKGSGAAHNVIVYSGEANQDSTKMLLSNDGLAFRVSSDWLPRSTHQGIVVVSPFENAFFLFAQSKARKSLNGGMTFNEYAVPTQNPAIAPTGGWAHPTDRTTVGLADASNKRFWEYSTTGPMVRDGTSLVSSDGVSDGEVYTTPLGSTVVRVITLGGGVLDTANTANMFRVISAPKLTPCPVAGKGDGRLMWSSPINRSLIATWCTAAGNDVSYSVDGGANWAKVSGADWAGYGCTQVSAAFVQTDNKVLVFCRDRPPVTVAF